MVVRQLDTGPVTQDGDDPVRHRAETMDACDRLADVWSATTDDGRCNGGLERPAMQSAVP